MKLCISGWSLLRGGIKMSGAEWGTVRVQGPVRGDLVDECVVCGIDGRSEGMGSVTRKVIDVQVV